MITTTTHIVLLLLGPALGLVLRPADLLSPLVTVLDKRSAAHLDRLGDGLGLVLDEAVLPVVLVALLLLLRLVVGHVGRVAPLVVGVVALDHLVVLDLLHHLDLVDAPLAIGTRTSPGHVGKTGCSSLSLASYRHRETAAGLAGRGMFGMVSNRMSSMMFLSIAGIEGECVEQ